MNRPVFYLAAVALHAAVLVWVNPPEGKILSAKDEEEKKYIDVTLSSEPGPAKPGPDSGPSDQAKAAVAPGPLVQDSPPPVATITPEPTPPPPEPPPPEIVPPVPPPAPVPAETTPPVAEQTPLVESPPIPAPPPPPVTVAVPPALVALPPKELITQPPSLQPAAVSGAPVSGAGRGNAAQWSLGAGGNGHFYRAYCVPQGITWPAANAYAKSHGGYLATIESAAENDFVFNLVDDPKYWFITTCYLR